MQPNRDLRRVLRGQRARRPRSSRKPETLKELVTDLNSWPGAREPGRRTGGVGAGAARHAARGIPRARRPGRDPADAAGVLPRGDARGALVAPALDAAIPWITQARALVQPEELKGLAADLRQAVPSLVKLNTRLVPLLRQLRALSSCTNHVSSPSRSRDIPSIEAGNSGQLGAPADHCGASSGSAGESRVKDANTPVFHIQGVNPFKLATGRLEPAAPLDPNTPPHTSPGRALRDPAAAEPPGAAAATPRAREAGRERRHQKASTVDFLAIVGVAVVGLAAAVYILSQQNAALPVRRGGAEAHRGRARERPGRPAGPGADGARGRGQVGRISDVNLENGVAVVGLDIEPEYKDMIREDATALLRPKTALKDMFIEIDPATGPVPDGGRITVGNTLPDIDPDEIYSALGRRHAPVPKAARGRGRQGPARTGARTCVRCSAASSLSTATSRRVTRATASRRRALEHLCTTTGCS